MANRGLTLTETILGGVLLVVVFFAVVSILPHSILALRQGHDLVLATNLGQSLMEEAKDTPLPELQPSSGKWEDMAYQVDVSDSPDGTAEVKKIRVQVRWERGRIAHNQVFETRVFRFPYP